MSFSWRTDLYRNSSAQKSPLFRGLSFTLQIPEAHFKMIMELT